MRRQALVAVVLAALTLTAGCAGSLGPDETSLTPTTDDPATTDAPEGNTLDQYPNGYTASGISDAEAAVAAHKSAMMDSKSWTATYETRFDSEKRSVNITEVRRVNHAESVELHEVTTPFGERSTYKNDAEGWQIQNAFNQTSYKYVAKGYNSTAAAHIPALNAFLKNVNYTQESIVQENGTSYVKYRSTGLTEDSEFASTENSSSKLENISSTFLVTADGRVTSFEFSATAVSTEQPTTNVSIGLMFEKVGDTTVDEPNWLDAAQNETSGSAPPAPNSTR